LSSEADFPAQLPIAGRDAETHALLRRRDQLGLRQLLLDHGGVVREWLLRRFQPHLDDAAIDAALGQALHQVWRTAPGFDPRQGTLRAWFGMHAQHGASGILARRRHRWQLVGGGIETPAAARSSGIPGTVRSARSFGMRAQEELLQRCGFGFASTQPEREVAPTRSETG
jgi:hypothetical protein